MNTTKTDTRWLLVTAMLGLAGCGGASANVEDTLPQEASDQAYTGGADDTVVTESAVSSTVAAGSSLQSTDGLNIRTGPGAKYGIIGFIPKGERATVVNGTPTNGWYNVSYGGATGWSSGSYLIVPSTPAPTTPSPTGPCGELASGAQLSEGQVLNSCGGKTQLVMQGDGNLVLYLTGGRALWASNTAFGAGGRTVMQGDGNLVIYTSAGSARWASNTDGKPGAKLAVQDDGNLVIYASSGQPIWASQTSVNGGGGPSTAPSTGGSGNLSTGREGAIARAKSGLGFSYWWGGGRWSPGGATDSNRGYCSGLCPNCSHSGWGGADCSGYVAKIWQVPASNNNLEVNSHEYSTATFSGAHSLWRSVSRDALVRGDALVYRSGSSGHIFLYDSGDGWGSMWVYESAGCQFLISHHIRTAGTAYKAIARTGY